MHKPTSLHGKGRLIATHYDNHARAGITVGASIAARFLDKSEMKNYYATRQFAAYYLCTRPCTTEHFALQCLHYNNIMWSAGPKQIHVLWYAHIHTCTYSNNIIGVNEMHG